MVQARAAAEVRVTISSRAAARADNGARMRRAVVPQVEPWVETEMTVRRIPKVWEAAAAVPAVVAAGAERAETEGYQAVAAVVVAVMIPRPILAELAAGAKSVSLPRNTPVEFVI